MNYIVYLLFIDPQFSIEMDPLKLVVSVIHNIESIQKGMRMKEAELSRKRELSETYKKISLLLMREIHAKEMQIKSMKIESLSSVFLDKEDEWLVSELTPEEKMSEECHYVQFVRTEGNYITLSS